MYAAAAGASLGSRQARKQQRIQNTKNAALLQQTLKDKLAAAKTLQMPTKSRQFHQLPANYLRTPAGQARKASFGQQSTSNSRLLLPITEMSSVASSTRNIHEQHLHRGHLKSPHHSRHASFNHKSRGHLNSSGISSHHHHPPHHHSRGSPGSSHHHHHSNQHHPHYHLNLNPDCAIHGSYSQLLQAPGQRLNRSATATLPLNDLNTPPSTPLSRHPKHPNSQHLLMPLLGHRHAQHRNSFSTLHLATVHPPDGEGGLLMRRTSEVDFKRHPDYHHMEPIIITPATPLPSPHKHQQQQHQQPEDGQGAVGGEEEGAASNVLLIDLRPSTPTQVHKSTDNLSRCESPTEPPQLERKCSVYRPRPGPEQKYYYYDDESKWNENDTYYDSYGRAIKYELDPNGVQRVASVDGEPCSYDLMVPTAEQQHQHQQQHGNSWISPEYFCEAAKIGRKHSTGICTCDHVECAQGKAAWLERGRRCSVQDQNAASCHRRWVKRNRIHDSSLGGSSDEDDFLGVLRGPSSFANAFLYVGLGTVAIGLIISFVGTGEKGFKTVELRLIGPSLIGIGLICCILRILFCICPSTCITNRKKKKTNKVDADYTTSLLRSESNNGSRGGGGAVGGAGNSIKRVQIARGPNSMQKFPSTHSSHRLMKTNSKTMEGMEALRQIATTSLLIQGGGASAAAAAMAADKQAQLQLQQSSSGTGLPSVRHQAFTSSNSSSLKRGNNRVVPIIKEPESILDDQEDVKRFDVMSVDIFNLSDGDDEDDDDEDDEANSNSMRSPDEDSKASVIHRIIQPGPSNQSSTGGGAGNRTESTGGISSTKNVTTILSTVNEKNHTEIEPGGSFSRANGNGTGAVKKTMTTVAEVMIVPKNSNTDSSSSSISRTTTTNISSKANGTATASNETTGNKLSRDRAPTNLGAIAKRPSAGRLLTSAPSSATSSGRVNLTTQATPTTLLDAVLIETSLCEPISPSFTINLPNVIPMSPPSNFSISDNKRETSHSQRPLFPSATSTGSGGGASSSSSFPLPPNFAYSSSSSFPSTTAATASSSKVYPPPPSAPSSSSANKFSYHQLLPGTSESHRKSTTTSNNNSNKPSASGGELELVLSPANLGQ